MTEARVVRYTPLFSDTDPMSEPYLAIPEGVTVNVEEEGKQWCKVSYKNQVGYIIRNDLCILSDKISNIMISIPKDHANSLYEALRYALKK